MQGSDGGAAAAAGGGGSGVQELQEAVAADAVGAWPQEAAASYSLSAVVRHMGELVSVGHFTSDVLNAEVSDGGVGCWQHKPNRARVGARCAHVQRVL
jgi:hypothetical protein